jgi:hypothetical protein
LMDDIFLNHIYSRTIARVKVSTTQHARFSEDAFMLVCSP